MDCGGAVLMQHIVWNVYFAESVLMSSGRVVPLVDQEWLGIGVHSFYMDDTRRGVKWAGTHRSDADIEHEVAILSHVNKNSVRGVPSLISRVRHHRYGSGFIFEPVGTRMRLVVASVYILYFYVFYYCWNFFFDIICHISRLFVNTLFYVVKYSRLSNLGVRELGAAMLLVLRDLHRAGVLHGDVKPNNIVECKRENGRKRYVLIDYSHAFMVGENGWPVQVKGMHGTVPFMSVNAMAGRSLTPLDDLESLAYTLFYLVSGGLPWFSEMPGAPGLMTVEVMAAKLNNTWCDTLQERAKKIGWPQVAATLSLFREFLAACNPLYTKNIEDKRKFLHSDHIERALSFDYAHWYRRFVAHLSHFHETHRNATLEDIAG